MNWGIKTGIYSLKGRETRSLRSRCGQGWLLLEALTESLSQASFLVLLVVAVFGVSNSPQSLLLSSPVSSSVAYENISHWTLGPSSIQDDLKTLNYLYLQRPHF